MDQTPEPKTIRDVAKICGRSVQQIRVYRDKHGLGIKVNGGWQFSEAEVARFQTICANAHPGRPRATPAAEQPSEASNG